MKRTILLQCILLALISPTLYGDESFTNHLDGESSPYLRQHVHNPVDWYPWGEEAFRKARMEHKPIFLSIGYSTCHWCHVMEKESFENPQIADLINRWFVAVKVDREQMPDLDKHFQRVYRLLHRRGGGWPLTIFLTEEGKPFFAATYLPPVDSYGVKGLKSLIPYFGRLYRQHRVKIDQRSAAIERLLAKSFSLPPKKLPTDLKIAHRAVQRMWETYDRTYKGWGNRPKFPESARIRFLLDIVKLDGDETARRMAFETLEKMADSGLYDQIDGAFFRYCVDRAWTMPHFEKMLYTNAELIGVYTKAWRMSAIPRFEEVAKETIAEIVRRFRTKEGLFMSASDADSDGQEGGYFLYRYDETLAALLKAGVERKVALENLRYLDISEDGNFDTEFSHPVRTGESPPGGFERVREVLKKIRRHRHYPFVDRKVITAWNGMMIEALFDAATMDAAYLDLAESSYRALVEKMGEGHGILYHQALVGEKPTQRGMLEDYAFMAAAALAGYRQTLESRYLQDALRWTHEATTLFYRKNGRWLLSSGRVKAWADFEDSYYTSPLSKLLNVMLDLAVLTSDLGLQRIVEETLEARGTLLERSPQAYPEALRALVRMRRGIVGLKGPKGELLRQKAKIARIRYPFVVTEAVEGETFVVCDMRSCFAFGKRLEDVLQAIEAR